MNPDILGTKYDKIAHIYNNDLNESQYGVQQFEKALQFCIEAKNVLDVGCGTGGRFLRILEEKSLDITALDVSEGMLKFAQEKHSKVNFVLADICKWQTNDTYDFIFAWDSIFHLPLVEQKNVISKLTSLLNKGGVLMYTFGNDIGEHTDSWHDDTFYYSSIGINENLNILIENGLSILHMELDQYPQKHVYVIATKV